MLSARYLAGCSDDLVRLYSQLESDIIVNMSKRLKSLDTSSDSMKYQAQILKEIGALRSDILKSISKYDSSSQKMILQLFDEATQKATENDLRAFKHGERKLSANQEQVIEATARKLKSTAIVNSNKKTREDFANGQAIKVFSGLQRLTMTIADTASGDFVTRANQAYMQVSSGAFTYDEALKSSVDDLAKMGVHTVEYTDSGHLIKRTIESAVRTNIVTGLNQTVAQITLDNCQDLGTSLVEVSAHVGARPDHAEWQGKIYSLNGKVYNSDGSIKYEDFYEKCHPGEPTGICGINCRHSYYPYFEGSEPMYSEGQLDELKDAKVHYGDQELTRYDAEQQLRLYERAIRKWKLRAEAEETAGIDNTDARIRLGDWQRKAQDFCNKTGLRRDYAREYVGTAKGKQPRGLTELPKSKNEGNKNKSLQQEEDYSIIPKSDYAPFHVSNKPELEMTDEERFKNAYNKVSEHGYETGNEMAILVDKRGFSLETSYGTQRDVAVIQGRMEDIIKRAPKNSLFLIHNHPTGSKLSEADIQVFIENKSIGGIFAIAPNGTAYEIRALNDGGHSTWEYFIKRKRYYIQKFKNEIISTHKNIDIAKYVNLINNKATKALYEEFNLEVVKIDNAL